MEKVASHINEMQKIYEDYGSVFDQLVAEQTGHDKEVDAYHRTICIIINHSAYIGSFLNDHMRADRDSLGGWLKETVLKQHFRGIQKGCFLTSEHDNILYQKRLKYDLEISILCCLLNYFLPVKVGMFTPSSVRSLRGLNTFTY